MRAGVRLRMPAPKDSRQEHCQDRARSLRQHFRRGSRREMGCHGGCRMGAHDNQIGATLLREINNAGARRSTGKASAQPRTFPKILGDIAMEGLFERHPIQRLPARSNSSHERAPALLHTVQRAYAHKPQPQPSADRESVAQMTSRIVPRLALADSEPRAHGKDGAMRVPKTASASEPSRKRSRPFLP